MARNGVCHADENKIKDNFYFKNISNFEVFAKLLSDVKQFCKEYNY